MFRQLMTQLWSQLPLCRMRTMVFTAYLMLGFCPATRNMLNRLASSGHHKVKYFAFCGQTTLDIHHHIQERTKRKVEQAPWCHLPNFFFLHSFFLSTHVPSQSAVKQTKKKLKKKPNKQTPRWLNAHSFTAHQVHPSSHKIVFSA